MVVVLADAEDVMLGITAFLKAALFRHALKRLYVFGKQVPEIKGPGDLLAPWPCPVRGILRKEVRFRPRV